VDQANPNQPRLGNRVIFGFCTVCSRIIRGKDVSELWLLVDYIIDESVCLVHLRISWRCICSTCRSSNLY
jgi:hypothetical protein